MVHQAPGMRKSLCAHDGAPGSEGKEFTVCMRWCTKFQGWGSHSVCTTVHQAPRVRKSLYARDVPLVCGDQEITICARCCTRLRGWGYYCVRTMVHKAPGVRRGLQTFQDFTTRWNLLVALLRLQSSFSDCLFLCTSLFVCLFFFFFFFNISLSFEEFTTRMVYKLEF